MHSIKTKLIFAISLLIIVIFTIAGGLLISEKQKELSLDIYTKARSLSELATPKITDLYINLLAEKSFVMFNSQIKGIFAQDEDVRAIKIYSFAGEILYDSVVEKNKAYEGETRTVSDKGISARVKANMPSFALADGRVVFLKKNDDSTYQTVNENEKDITGINDTDVILNIIYPFQGKFAVEYDVTYENLYARVVRTTERIVLLLIFGILLGLGFGWYFADKITTPIAKLTSGALVLAKGDFTMRVNVKTHDEVGVLAETFNTMARDLEISTKALVYKERVAKELEVAAKMQSQILPAKMPSITGLDIAAMVVPAAEIGGDCYDFIQVDPETNLIYISDVTGHGIPSGLVVSIANALIYSYAKSPSMNDILINTNRVLKEKTVSNMFMTLLMLRFHGNVVNYVSAGHPEMLHYIASENKVITEKGGGIALGMVQDISKMVNELSLDFRDNDCIVLYSDGIPEALSERGEQYGIQRFKRALNDHGDLASAEAIKNALVSDVKQFMNSATQMDDITLVVIKKKTKN